jgi:class 3 adenylate cyclase/ligand-binding sensor domain-containing protein/ActR/RegA family two-component response regulator
MRKRVLHIILCLLASEAFAQIDTLDLPFSALTINDGLSQGMVNTIVQDDQGFMWFGTKDGLNRYDGYSFTVFRHDPEDDATIRESNVICLYKDPHGRLWVGTANGLDLFEQTTERFIHVPIELGQVNMGGIAHIVMDDNGDLWLGYDANLVKVTFEGPISGSTIPPFTLQVFDRGHTAIARTRDGTMWGSAGGVPFRAKATHGGVQLLDTIDIRITGDKNNELGALEVVEDTIRNKLYAITHHVIAEIDQRSGAWKPLFITEDESNWLMCLNPQVDRAGILWFITFKGLCRFDPVTRTVSILRATEPDLQEAVNLVKWTLFDRNGTLWVGSSGYGLLKYDPRIERFHTWKDASIRALAPTPEGDMLVTKYNRLLNVYDPLKRRYEREVKSLFDLFPGLQGIAKDRTSDLVVKDDRGVYWFSISDLVHYDPATNTAAVHIASLGPGHREGGLFPLLLARDGHLWCGGDSALWRFDRVARTFKPFKWPIPTTNNPYQFVTSIVEAPDGVLWAGTMRGVLRLDPLTSEWKHFTHDPANDRSLAVEVVFSICIDANDGDILWVGTSGGGLNRLDTRTGEVKRFSTKEGLPNDVVYGVLQDERGDLWMSTNKGLSRFTPSTGRFRNFAAGDGLQSDEFNRHAYCKDAEGRLWFGGVNGFNWFDPKELVEDTTPVVVRITGIKLMNKPLSFRGEGAPLTKPVFLSDGMEIPYSANMVSFSFASMEFAAPELHQYRYKLEGFDPDWIDAGTENSAIYTNLDPGTYTFRVRGMNRDGIWDMAGTSFRLVVRPPWYMTWWFYVLVVILLIGGTLLYIRSVRKQREKLEMTVFIRTHEMSREKDRADELLKNILPAGIAAELKRMGHAEARHYEQVTVLFSDFKDFTGVSERLSPSELVDELNVCFNAFDRIMEKYGVEKIKTIGDAYMAAGGVPDPSGGMPIAVVHAALEMQGIMAERRIERIALGKPAFEMRVGVHTGPVVAGIVGRRKFQYDIWGDTVNIASRMESTGEVGEVNISGATYAIVKDEPDLTFRSRGRMQVKGKGEMEMFFVSGAAMAEPVNTGPAMVQQRAGTVGVDREPLMATRELKDLRILLAEDNSFNVMVAQDELEFAIPGVKVEVASNGKEAVDLATKNTYDVVLMDVQMPGMDGYQATRAIRAMPGNKSRLPIIALTANVMQAEVDRCMEAGMNAFVPKPFKREELMKALQEVLSQTRPT